MSDDIVETNLIDLMPHLEAKKRAELLLSLQEIRNEAAMLRQGELLVELHNVLNLARFDQGVLTEEEILEAVKVFHMQVADGYTIL